MVTNSAALQQLGFSASDAANFLGNVEMSGLLLLMVGILLLVESFLILKGIIMPEKAIFVVVGTIIIGVIVVAVVTSYYSKH